MTEDLLRGVVAYFAIIDPVGNLLIFEALAGPLDRKGRAALAVGSNAVAFGTIALFVFGGITVLDYLDIGLSSFRISAGVLLVPMAFRMVEYGQPFDVEPREETVSPMQLAVVPLAIPLLAGPAALATSVSFSSTLGRPVTLLAAGLVLLLSTALFVLGSRILGLLGPAFLRVLTRLIGIILMAIAVDFIVSGLADVF